MTTLKRTAKLNTNHEITLYFVNELGGFVGGKKKMMKLFFLFGYYDFDSKEIKHNPIFNKEYEFSIYHYGVYNNKIMKDIMYLINNDFIENGYPLKIRAKGKEHNIHNSIIVDDKCADIKDRLDKVIKEFGEKYNGFELEIQTLKMLGLTLGSKSIYKGLTIERAHKLTQVYKTRDSILNFARN